MFKFIAVSKRLRYNFTIKSKYTVVIGMSAKGKTTLMRLLNEPMSAKIECPLSFKVFNSREYSDAENNFKNNHNIIFFIDEMCINGLNYDREKFCELLRKSDNYFVLFGREDLNLTTSVSSTVKIEYDLNSNTNYFVDYYPVTNLDKDSIIEVDRIVTEDLKSGNILLRTYFDSDKVIPVSSNGDEGGISRMSDFIRNSDEVDTLIVYDALSALRFEKPILDECMRKYRSRWYRFHPESIEQYILDSEFVKRIYTYELPDYPEEHLEDWYEDKLKEALPLSYSKKSASPCLLYKCGSSGKPVCYSCPNLKLCKDKRSELIYGALSQVRIRGTDNE